VSDKFSIGPTAGNTHHSIQARLNNPELMQDEHGVTFRPVMVHAAWLRVIGAAGRAGDGWTFVHAHVSGLNSLDQLCEQRWTKMEDAPDWVRGWMWMYAAPGIEIPGFEDNKDDDDY
jgi:hypothetical protein